jgi:hypothetical protein
MNLLGSLTRLPHPLKNYLYATNTINKSIVTLFHSARVVSNVISPVNSRSAAASSNPRFPYISEVLKKFLFLVHPDLFTTYPAYQLANEESVQKFNSFISSLKYNRNINNQYNYPPNQTIQLAFFVKKRSNDNAIIRPNITLQQLNLIKSSIEKNKFSSPAAAVQANKQFNSLFNYKPYTRAGDVIEGEFHKITITLQTNGGNSRILVTQALQHLFIMLNLPNKFKWQRRAALHHQALT